MVAGHNRVCHYNYPVDPPVYTVGGLAVSHWCDLHLLLFVSSGVGRPLFPMGLGRELSYEFRLACLIRLRRNSAGLDPDENEKLHFDVADRGARVGNCRMGI